MEEALGFAFRRSECEGPQGFWEAPGSSGGGSAGLRHAGDRRTWKTRSGLQDRRRGCDSSPRACALVRLLPCGLLVHTAKNTQPWPKPVWCLGRASFPVPSAACTVSIVIRTRPRHCLVSRGPCAGLQLLTVTNRADLSLPVWVPVGNGDTF